MKHSVSKQSTFNSENEEAKSYLDEKGYKTLNKYLHIIGYSGIGEYVHFFRKDFYTVDDFLVYNRSFKDKTWLYKNKKYLGLKWYQFGKRTLRFFKRKIEVPFIVFNQNKIFRLRTNLDFCVLRSDFHNLSISEYKLELATCQFNHVLNKIQTAFIEFGTNSAELIHLGRTAKNITQFWLERSTLEEKGISIAQQKPFHLKLVDKNVQFSALAYFLQREGIIKNAEIFTSAFVEPKQKISEKIEFHGDHLLLLFIVRLAILRGIIVANDGNYIRGITKYFRSGKNNCDFKISSLHSLATNNGLTEFSEEKLQKFLNKSRKGIYWEVKKILD